MNSNHILFSYLKDIELCRFNIMCDFSDMYYGVESGDGDTEDAVHLRLFGKPNIGDGFLNYRKLGEQKEFFQWHCSWFEQY